MKIEDNKSLVDASNDKNVKFSFPNFFQRLINILKNNKKTEEGKNNLNEDNNKKDFIDSIKVEESEESKLLKLQKKYRNGEIKEEDLSEEQVSKLIELYDKQINAKKKENAMKRAKIDKLKKKS